MVSAEKPTGTLKRIVGALLSVIAILTTCVPLSQAEFQFPLKSISPTTTPFGEQRFRFGVLYNKKEKLLFQKEDRDRQVYTLPSLDLSVGVSPDVELLFSYPFLLINQNDQEQNFGSGDLTISGIFRLIREGTIFPECAIKFSTKLPNADDTKGFGTDETDFFMGGVFSRKIGPLKLLLNADLAILGNPNTNQSSQDDVLVYRVGVIYPLQHNLSAGLEVDGTEFSTQGNDRRFIRGGIAFNWQEFLIDLGGALALTEASGEFQVGVGITLKFGIARESVYCP